MKKGGGRRQRRPSQGRRDRRCNQHVELPTQDTFRFGREMHFPDIAAQAMWWVRCTFRGLRQKLPVVAEEREKQAQVLRIFGCVQYQNMLLRVGNEQ